MANEEYYLRIEFVTVDGYSDYTDVIDEDDKDVYQLLQEQHPNIYDDILTVIGVKVLD